MAFSFVNYDGPGLPEDPNVRKLIRRQAMRDVASERKSRGSYGQSNLRQYPVFLTDGHVQDEQASSSLPESSLDSEQDVTKHPRRKRCPASSRTHPPALPFSMVYPDLATTEKFALLLNLVPLTGLRLGIAKVSSPKYDLVSPTNPFPTSNVGNAKLAHFITNRYAETPTLRYATDCVIAKLRQTLRCQGRPSKHDQETVLRSYTKALKALQAALGDETQRMTPETLCATELLALFELLDDDIHSHSWIHHAGGAAQLIQIRGTNRFNTESEMTLFMAHIGPTVMDAFLGNKSCFLEEEKWKKLMRSVIRSEGSLIQQQGLAIAMWCHLVEGPKRFREVTDVITAPTSPSQAVINAMINQILLDWESLVSWMELAPTLPGFLDEQFEVDEYGILFPRLTFDKDKSHAPCVTQLALWGTNIMCRILKARLLVAMAPVRFRLLEVECQRLASRIMMLQKTVAENNSEGLLQTVFISQSTWIAKGVVETQRIWDEATRENGEGMIKKWKFEAWCKAIGRKF